MNEDKMERRRSDAALADIPYIRRDLDEMKRDIKELKGQYVTIETHTADMKEIKTELDPIKRIVYGVVGLILVAVVGALLTLVLKQ